MADLDIVRYDKTGAGGMGLRTPWPYHLVLWRAVAETAIAGADPSATTVTLTNWGTSANELGALVIPTFDYFTEIRIIWRAASNGAQTGTITCDLYDGTAGAVLVSQAFASNTTLTTRSTTAAIALTGQRLVYARVTDSVATDDPIFCYVGMEMR